MKNRHKVLDTRQGSFECEKCGLCCKRADKFVEAFGRENFPYETKADGSCEMLDENNLCKVYKDRPIICNLKEFAKVLQIDEKEWYRLNKEGCKILREQGL